MVLTDDQTLAALRRADDAEDAAAPGQDRHDVHRGDRRPRPLCCPSRATLITGQYGHNNGVLRNNYDDLREKDNTLPVWLDARRLHDDPRRQVHEPVRRRRSSSDRVAAPGWDEWHSVDRAALLQLRAQVNGGVEPHGAAPEDYLGRVLTERSDSLIERYAPKEDPFFLQLDHYAPHISVGEEAAPSPTPGAATDGAVPDPVDYGPVRRRAAADAAQLQRGGRLRQALVHADDAAARRGDAGAASGPPHLRARVAAPRSTAASPRSTTR